MNLANKSIVSGRITISAAFFAAAAIIFSCAKTPGINRVITSKNTGFSVEDAEGVFIIRSVFADIYAENLSEETLNGLMRKPPFTTAGGDERIFRVPRFTYFFLTVKNTGAMHINIDSISISCGEKKNSPMTLETFRGRTKSPAYSLLDAEAFLSRRRIFGSEAASKKINFETETARYKFQFIPAGDTVLIPLVFEWIPAECRNFILSADIKSGGTSRPIEFHLSREEYRTKGKNFREKNPGAK